MHFLEIILFVYNFIEVYSVRFGLQKVSIGSGNGLAPIRYQAIT